MKVKVALHDAYYATIGNTKQKQKEQRKKTDNQLRSRALPKKNSDDTIK